MKVNRILTTCAVAAALLLSAGSLLAQNDNGNDNGGGRRPGGPGGFGGRNFDPAEFQQRMMEGIRDRLGFTNDTEWTAVQPLVQKVMDARRDIGVAGGFGRAFGRRGGNAENGGQRRGGPGGFFGQPSPEAEALQKALDDNAPASQIKDLLAKYTASQKEKQTKLEQAQADLRKVLTVKQEAEATLLGLLN